MSDKEWRPIKEAPKNGAWIEARWAGGQTEMVHWAEDMSGEEQPAFVGWFRAVKDSNGNTSYYAGVSEPIEWRTP